MGRLQIVLSEDIEKKFRQHLGKGEGLKKGMISKEIEKLILEDLNKPDNPKNTININFRSGLMGMMITGSKSQEMSIKEYITKILEFMHFGRPELLGII